MSSKNCPTVVATGRCTTDNCPHNHAVLVCEPCGHIAGDANGYAAHVRGRKHLMTVSGQNQFIQCPLCTVNMTMPAWTAHLNGKKHQKRARDMGVSADVTPHQATTTEQFAICEVCKVQIRHDMLPQHTQSRRHKGRETFMQYRAVLDEAEKDKNGLVVEGGGDLGFLDPVSTRGKLCFTVYIQSTLPFGKSELRDAKLLSQHGSRTVASGYVAPSHLESPR
jgi:helicase MOV-10